MIPLAGRDPRFAELDRLITRDEDNPQPVEKTVARASRRPCDSLRAELLADLREAEREAERLLEPERARRIFAIVLARRLYGTSDARRLIHLIRTGRWRDLYDDAEVIARRTTRARAIEQQASRKVYTLRRRCDDRLGAKGASAYWRSFSGIGGRKRA